MADVDQYHRDKLVEFAVDQYLNNPAGIGNECTHWVYAALLEARALDRARSLHISQSGVPFTWGRHVNTLAAKAGDITQFHGYRTEFFTYLTDSSGTSRWFDGTRVRGPNHTGMLMLTPKDPFPGSGTFVQMESHIHEPGYALMTLRGNKVFYESFAVALTASDVIRVKSAGTWPTWVNDRVNDELLWLVDWGAFRAAHAISNRKATAAIAQIRRGHKPMIDGKEMACVFRVRSSGHLRFYSPQASSDRLAMNATQFATEKARLIATLIRDGRRGTADPTDEFGGDLRTQRISDHRFDWTFRPTLFPRIAAAFLRNLSR